MATESKLSIASLHQKNATDLSVTRNAESLFSCGTPTPTPGLENLGLQIAAPALKTWTPIPTPCQNQTQTLGLIV